MTFFPALLSSIALVSMGSAMGVIGCVASDNLPQAKALVTQSQTPLRLDSLQRGRALAVTECAACHRMYWPREYSPRQWVHLGPTMSERALLSRDQARDLTRYLVLASRHQGAP